MESSQWRGAQEEYQALYELFIQPSIIIPRVPKEKVDWDAERKKMAARFVQQGILNDKQICKATHLSKAQLKTVRKKLELGQPVASDLRGKEPKLTTENLLQIKAIINGDKRRLWTIKAVRKQLCQSEGLSPEL